MGSVRQLGLAAETAADVLGVRPHRAFRDAEDPGELLPELERHLAAGPHVQPVGGRDRDADERLQVHVLHAGEGEGVGEHVVAFVPRVRLTHGVPVFEADVTGRPEASARSRPVVRHHAGWGLGKQLGRTRTEGLLDRGDDRQDLVLDFQQVQGGKRGPFVDGGHRGHDVTDVADRVQRDDRLVLDQRAIGRRQIAEPVAGEHGGHPVEPVRGGGVDGHDTGVGVRAAQHLGVQHAGQGDVVAVPRPSRHLGSRVEARRVPPGHLPHDGVSSCSVSSPSSASWSALSASAARSTDSMIIS